MRRRHPTKIRVFNPKVRQVTSDDVEHLYRWCVPPNETNLTGPREEIEALTTIRGRIVITLNVEQHQLWEVLSNGSVNGWALFRLLSLETPPERAYLVSAAVNGAGDWIDGSLLEGVFNCVTELRQADEWPAEVTKRLEAAADLHRQASFADWQIEWQQTVIKRVNDELEQEVSRIELFEGQLQEVKRQVRTTTCSAARQALLEQRAELRSAILDSERHEAELTKCLLTQQTSPVQSNIMDLFCIEWTIQSATAIEDFNTSHKEIKRKRRRLKSDGYIEP